MRAALLITAGVWAAGTGTVFNAAALEGDGFSAPDGGRSWSLWQTRLTVSTPAPAARYAAANQQDGAGLKWRSLRMMGDYYFSPSLAVQPSGFRATSGLLLGTRSSMSWGAGGSLRHAAPSGQSSGGLQAVAWPATSPELTSDSATVPYVGIGYTGTAGRGGLSFSADLGLMAVGGATAVKLGRGGVGGAQSLDDTLRDMRLSPVLQLGVSYSF